MITKRLKSLLRLGTLIATRQIYFLGRNWYQMAYSPYLTLKDIKVKRDKSQFLLIVLSALTPIIVYVAARLIWDLIKYQRLLWLTGNVFVAMVVIQLLILGYLAYWTIQVLLKE
jgi:hypothetical protein